MIDFSDFYQLIAKSKNLSHWLETLPAQIAEWKRKSLSRKEFKQWINAVKLLPKINPYELNLLHGVIAKSKNPLSAGQNLGIKKLMKKLIPWRKGPFFLYGLNIESEWRSDVKWNHVFPHLSNLTNRTILDVGCGNGYYLWRMIGAGARLVVGIDPMHLFFFQFKAVCKLLSNNFPVYLLPLRIEHLPSLSAFDTVFSMGVLYHCRSPLGHLWKLKDQLVNGGELVLETIIVEGDENTAMVPSDRYARMSNVYFVPSILALKKWLSKCGFIDIRIVDVRITTNKEQRITEWVTVYPMINSSDSQKKSEETKNDSVLIRAVLIATKP